MRSYSTGVYLPAFKFVFHQDIQYFDLIFSYYSGGFEVLNAIFQASVYITIVTATVY